MYSPNGNDTVSWDALTAQIEKEREEKEASQTWGEIQDELLTEISVENPLRQKVRDWANGLPGPDKTIIRLWMCGKTQEEIAAVALGSQRRVSRRLAKLMTDLQVVVKYRDV